MTRSYVSMHPFSLYQDRVSDHAPLLLSISSVASQPSRHQSIPSWVTRSSLFKQSMQRVIASRPELSSLPATVSISIHKDLIKDTAKLVRNVLLEDTSNKDAKCTILHSISRAVFYQNHSLASHLIDTHSLAATHLLMNSSYIKLRTPHIFAELVRDTQFSSQSAQLEVTACSPPSRSAERRKHSQRISNLIRRLQLWVPSNRSVTVTGIVTNTGDIIDNRSGMVEALRSAWQPLFSAKSVSHVAISQLFNFVPYASWDWSTTPPPLNTPY